MATPLPSIECSAQPLSISFHPSKDIVAAGLVDGTVEIHDLIAPPLPNLSDDDDENSNSSDNDDECSFQPFDSKVYSSVNNTPSATGTSNNSGNHPEWSSLYLYHQGLKQSDICNTYFPQTTNILEMKCPHRMAGKCGLGSVYFSKLKRNTKVIEHCGPTNTRWRCHLPLIVPKGEAAGGSCLRVGLPTVNEECVRWEEGVPILFDDSFLHSAVHSPNVVVKEEEDDDDEYNLDGARIVLIVDFWHPALSESDRNALGALYPPGS